MDAFLSRLDKVRADSGGWRANCPGHDSDSGSSLKVSEGREGVVFHCFVGCPPGQILEAMGLHWPDVFWKAATPDPEAKPKPFNARGAELESLMCARRLSNEPELLARLRADRGWAKGALEKLDVGWDGKRLTLPVRDKEGKLHDVLRYDPWAKGGYKMLATKGRSRLPWPTPERVDTSTLWVVEGEGTAISMASVGLTAVALPGAVARQTGDVRRPGKFEGVGWHSAWAKRLNRFPMVVLLPDCDEVGRLLMMTVQYDLRVNGRESHLIDLGLDNGKDVGDWLREMRTGEQRRLARDLLKMAVRTFREQPTQMAEALDMVRGWGDWHAPAAPVPVPVAAAADGRLDWS